MSNLLSFQTSVLSDVGSHPKITAQDIANWANQGITLMARFVDVKEDHFSFTTQVGMREYVMPTGLVQIASVTYMDILLDEATLTEAMKQYSPYFQNFPSPPSYWAVPYAWYTRRVFNGNNTPPPPGTAAQKWLDGANEGSYNLGFIFTPNDTQTVDILGKFLPSALILPGDVPGFDARWHPTLESYVLYRAWRKLKEMTLAAEAKAEFDKGLIEMYHEFKQSHPDSVISNETPY